MLWLALLLPALPLQLAERALPCIGPLAIVEGLSGQLYLVTVIALLVSRIGFRHPTRAASGVSGTSPQVDDATAGDRG